MRAIQWAAVAIVAAAFVVAPRCWAGCDSQPGGSYTTVWSCITGADPTDGEYFYGGTQAVQIDGAGYGDTVISYATVQRICTHVDWSTGYDGFNLNSGTAPTSGPKCLESSLDCEVDIGTGDDQKTTPTLGLGSHTATVSFHAYGTTSIDDPSGADVNHSQSNTFHVSN